ncbi:MAG: GapR family DNA-binding domain-containing protein [Pseudomonadota bacterium]
MADSSVAAGQLRGLIERIERLEEEKRAIADDIKDVYGEAKSNGFDTKVLRQVVRIRKQDQAERQEQEALLDLYLAALGGPAAGAVEQDDS